MPHGCSCRAASSAVPPSQQRRGGAGLRSSPPVTPLPLLPFFQEFRSQISRLEGVRELAMPQHLATAQHAEPPTAVRSGACHSDRLRFGHFLYANASGPGGNSKSGIRGRRLRSLSLLRGALYPSSFSFHPPLVFEVAAFNGGQGWVVSAEHVLLPPIEGSEADGSQAQAQWEQQREQEETQQQEEQQQQEQQPAGGIGWRRQAAGSGSWPPSEGLPPAASATGLTPDAWQQEQVQRLAGVRQLYSAAAVPLPAPHLYPFSAATSSICLSPGHLFLSSAQLPAERGVRGKQARAAALDSIGLPAFGAALSLHLNGLVAAPANASPAHVARMAAAQRAHITATARRPLLCIMQLREAFGDGWLGELQDQTLLLGLSGLDDTAAEEGGQYGASEFLYLDPSQLLQQPGDG